MEKVVLPKEVAEAIEGVWSDLRQERYTGPLQKIGCLTNWMMLEKYYSGQERILYPYFEENPVEYVTALAYGYKVKKSPEDELREVYEASSTDVFDQGYDAGVRFTLNTLGIEIEGINA
ncbi:hypothetical protein [Oceanobacillus neutriphilus]|uniref:DUF1642 domain-containing protein n=1 Tax=Oceanobacillus neutriphilus TaxID=531815 RepID=A0ABQ2NY76_9BACI|nr:hypothetical protein [Oceanobacillus neutriphilus]GGP13464.1 hypothetical protein GCM10011346_33560 [Oceanobacillus neutriphilus]